MSTNYIPCKWVIDCRPNEEVFILSKPDDGSLKIDHWPVIAKVFGPSPDREDRARLIVLAVNTHEELLTELQAMTDAYAKAMTDAGVTNYPEAMAVVRQARAAIAKAAK